jgi:hypothetical protein
MSLRSGQTSLSRVLPQSGLVSTSTSKTVPYAVVLLTGKFLWFKRQVWALTRGLCSVRSMSRSVVLLGTLGLVLLYVAGLAYVYFLPYRPQIAQEMYVDENALIPGMGLNGVLHKHSGTLRQIDRTIRDGYV